VIVDIPSGGDIEGCHKQEILGDLAREFPNNPIIQKKLEELDKDQEEKCFVGFWQPKPKNPVEFKKQWHEWVDCRTGVIANYEKNLRLELAQWLRQRLTHGSGV